MIIDDEFKAADTIAAAIYHNTKLQQSALHI